MKMTLNNVRLSFNSLDKPSNKFGGDPKYSASVIIDPATVDGKSQLEMFRTKIREVEANDLGGVKMPLDKVPMRDGNDKDYDGWKNTMIVKATSKAKPKILNRRNAIISATDDSFPYAGCYVDIVISLWAMKSPQYGNRICASLVAVRYRKDGDPFTGESLDVDSDLGTLDSDGDEDALDSI